VIDLDYAAPAQTDEEIFKECAARLKIALDAESENRRSGLEDRKFRYGDQWDDDARTTRETDKRPALTINLTDTFCRRVENNLRQQRPRIKAHPVDGGADIQTAEVVEGLIRHIETSSNATVAYDTAGSNAIDIGWGYIRVVADYVDAQSFDQDLKIKSVRNTLTGYIDPASVLPDGSDMRWFIFAETMSREEYRRQYPRKDEPKEYIGFSDPLYGDWDNKEVIRLAEYLRVYEKPEKLVLMNDGSTKFESELPSDEAMAASGYTPAVNQKGERITRNSARRVVQWFRIDGTKVVDQRELRGKWIPVVRVEGNALDVDGKVKRFGMVRNLRDPAVMFNYWRPLALNTPIPTPAGWSTMGALNIGDRVFDERGIACSVVGKSPVHLHRECFEVSFDDGTSIVADAEHPWAVEARGKRTTKGTQWEKKTISTAELVPGTHYIGTPEPLEMADAALPIHPYLVGAWLGDGSSSQPAITAGNDDCAEMRSILEGCGAQLGPRMGDPKRGATTFTMRGLRSKFVSSGLLLNKHVPAIYLRASREQRLSLLQGLMDTDGSISSDGQCSFTTTSDAIASGFAELLRTLGIKAVSCRRSARMAVGAGLAHGKLPQTQFSFTTYEPVFRMRRKLARIGLRDMQPRRTKRFRIDSVRRVASAPVQCIAVDSASHLFLAGPGFVPTHNTMQTERYALAPKAPWVAAEGQTEDHAEWNDANQRSYSVLTYKPITGPDGLTVLPPPQRQSPVPIESGMESAALSAERDLMAVAGMPQEGVDGSRVVSGNKYLARRQGINDLTHFQYYDNQSQAIAHVGRILLDLIPHYYDTTRMQRIIGVDGTPSVVKLNDKQLDQNGAIQTVKNDLTVGKYDVVMDAGPGYQTKREEGAEQMLMLLDTKGLGESISKVAPDLIVRNMDFAGAQDVADRLAPMTPEGMDKAIEGLPSQAKSIITGLQAKLKEADDLIQKQHIEIKYRTEIEDKWIGLERQKLLTTDATKRRDTDAKADTSVAVAEIHGATQLLNTNTEAGHDRAAAKDLIDRAQDAAAQH
jgi:hypothetical protein